MKLAHRSIVARRVAGFAIVLGLLALVAYAISLAGWTSIKGVAATAPGNWPTYHHDLTRTGYDAQQPAFSGVTTGWSAPTTVDGAVYAEPLVVGNTVVGAT